MTKNFTEYTKEELVEGIISFIIPQIVSEKETLNTYNMDQEDGKGYAIKKRDEKYLKANITWEYWDGTDEDFVDVDWEEITEEDVIECIRKETSELTLNQLRANYKRDEWLRDKLREKEILEDKLNLIKSLVK